MPELPEVETIRRTLEAILLHKKIERIEVIYPRIIDNATPEAMQQTLFGQELLRIERRGKYLIFRYDRSVLVSHLRMEGRYYFYDSPAKVPELDRHTHVLFIFSDYSELHYQDVRKFGRMKLYSNEQWENVENDKLPLGPEPSEMANGETLYRRFQSMKTSIKQALLNQKIIAGLGNIYVDETCFRSHIMPWTSVKDLTREQCDQIVTNAQAVLFEATKQGGSTVRSYHSAEGVDGRFQQELFVYGREGKPCRVCGTPIGKTQLGGRGTHFCPVCQAKIVKKYCTIIGVTGLIGSGKSTVSRMLQQEGFHVLDSDHFAREALEIDSSAYRKVIKAFGEDIKNSDQSINRGLLREKVLKNTNNLNKLEDILHPYVIARTKEEIKNRPNQEIVLDVPLLFESGMDKLCDWTVFVHVNDKTRNLRLLQRNTMPLNDTKGFTKRVITADKKMIAADCIVDNSLCLDVTMQQVKTLVEKIRNARK